MYSLPPSTHPAASLHLGVELHRVEILMRKLSMHATQAISSILHARREEEIAHRKLANNLFFLCVNGDWVVQPLGHAVL